MHKLHPNQSASPLLQLIQKQTVLVDEYINFLDKIKQTITGGDTEQLNQILASTQIDLKEIEKIGQQQMVILQRKGYEPSSTGLKNYIGDIAQPELEQSNQILSEKTRQLEKSLLINDLLIRKNQDRVRQSIRILSGHGPTQAAGTYSRQGNEDSGYETKQSLALA